MKHETPPNERHLPKVSKDERHQLNGHKSCVLWFTGLPSSGKSTLAFEVEHELFKRHMHSYVLDGDNLRLGLNQGLGFSQQDRRENVRRIGEAARLFADAGLIVLVAAISPYRADRERVRSFFSEDEFIEIYVKCPLAECERRDPKGLYKKARAGKIHDFTGISSVYEAPGHPEIMIASDKHTPKESVRFILDYLRDNGCL
ncbi:adenylyl-sulfate kinase [Paenibacillus sp. Leaf72]|uniref:adenylyl-sulfate kinase n=1 Tax=Paenibacillus sp. Leaf72 TaxID=1736234 RepID=UPI0006FE30C4|nr:adenylyl-sulfate kinase [Paenibacillus sp. Leaf72]KQO18296.1 adenylyl-sulfate kinase [Paenibacillus sp. Leaf72]